MFNKKIIVLVEVSARHLHLSQQDLEKLFVAGHTLTKTKQLSQPSEFACEETVNIQVGSKNFDEVRVVGPIREQTQVEISLTDAFVSGVLPPVRLSGNLKGSSSVILVGPAGSVELDEGLIVAQRHIHCNPKEAKKLKLKSGQIVSVEVKGERAVVFHRVEVRVEDGYKLGLHLDTDEGNAAGIKGLGEGVIIK